MWSSAQNTQYVLTVDLGTSGPKSALISTDGQVLDYEFEQNDVILLPNGGAEQRPDEWWDSIMATAKRVLDKRHVPVADIAAVCCTTQWSGTVPVDENGNALMNAIIWLDARGVRQIERITDGLIKIEGYALPKLYRWLRLTGGIPSGSGKDPIAHILFIKDQYPDIYNRTFKFLEPKDYINFKFTGKFAASYDSIALHWLTDNRDLNKVDYDDRLLRMAGVTRDKFPDLKRAVDVLGPIKPEIARELGLSENVQVVMGSPDLPCAAIGSGAVDDFAGHLYVGTSSWLTCHVPFKKTDIFHNMASLPSAIPEKYFIANEQETAGACLNFLRDNLLYDTDKSAAARQSSEVYKRFDRIVEAVPAGSNKLIFTPWLFGERTPIENHTVRSGFFNLSLQTNRAHLIRAVFEGVAYNAKWLLKYVEKFIQRPMNPIHIIGGGANSNVWCQIFADVLDRTIKQVQDPIQANLRGAGFLAAVSLGHLRFSDIARRIQIAETYYPDPGNRKIYDTLFESFLAIYKANRKIYKKLNQK